MLLPTSYAPNTTYLSHFANSQSVTIDVSEPYVRQTFRNHCEILTSQGVQKLSIPIEKKSTQTGTIKDAKIDYTEPWQRQHWRSLQAAYNNSPYFLYYQDSLQKFYEKKESFLVDFNFAILRYLLDKLRITNYELRIGTDSNQAQPNCQLSIVNCQFIEYQQVFTQTFTPNLSALDLLFNCGPESKSFLCKA